MDALNTPAPAPQSDAWRQLAEQPLVLAQLAAAAPALTVLRSQMQEVLELQRRSQGDEVYEDNGAPALAPALHDFSGDELALVLMALDTKMKETQARTSKEGIELARQQKDSANEAMLDKLQEAIDAREQAEEKEKSQKVWGWIGKVAAFIGAVAGVIVAAATAVVSGGVGVALLAIAVVGLVAATMDLASAINQEVNPGAEPFTMGSLIGDAVIAQMDADGTGGKGRAAASGMMVVVGLLLMQPDLVGQMSADAAIADGRSAEFAADLKMGMMFTAIAVTLVATIVLTIASGGASSSNAANFTAKSVQKATDAAAKGLDAVTDAASAARHVKDVVDKALAAYNTAQKIVQNSTRVYTAGLALRSVASVTQGVSQVGSGATAIAVAADEQDAAEARAMAKTIEAQIAKLSAQSEEQTERLRKIIEALQEGTQMFTQMVSMAADQRANTARNLVRA